MFNSKLCRFVVVNIKLEADVWTENEDGGVDEQPLDGALRYMNLLPAVSGVGCNFSYIIYSISMAPHHAH